jgi:TonB family protein
MTAAAALFLAAGNARADAPALAPGDHMPIVTRQDRPTYPYSLRMSGNRGSVLIDFVVDLQGNVVHVAVLKSSHPDFEAPAVEAVLKWKFKPGIKEGHPVSTHMQVPIFFDLTGGGGATEPWSIPEKAPKDAPVEFRYDQAPRPILTAAPVYPFDLLSKAVTGKATVVFAIDTQGRSHVLKVRSATLPEFGAATVAMIESWTFEPARKAGVPCWAVLTKEQEFSDSDRDFPVNDSGERLLGLMKKSPSSILADFRELDNPLKGRFLPQPTLPDSMRSANAGAEALIEFIVDHAGHAQLPRIISSTTPEFGWAAATAVARWQYTLPTKNGRPVDVKVRVPMVFSPPKLVQEGS